MTNNDEQFNSSTELTPNNERIDAAQTENGEQSVAYDVNSTETVNSDQTVSVDNGKKKRGKWEIIVNVALWVAIAVLVIAIVLRMFVFNTVAVQGPSMEPNYVDGEVVTVNKIRKPVRGDVVVFYKYPIDSKFKAMFAGKDKRGKDQPYELLIKRVVATEGDKIYPVAVEENEFHKVYKIVVETAEGDVVYEDYYEKDGKKLEPLVISGGVGLGNLGEHSKENPFVVSKGCFYAMGDNRPVSDDSRGDLGEVPLSRLFGVVIK